MTGIAGKRCAGSLDRAAPTWLRAAVYGLPVAGASYCLFSLQFYFLKFASDVLLMPPVAAGLVLGTGRLWDAVTDPAVGVLSDRTRSRWGRRRPWMLAGLVPLGLAFVAVWSPPASLGNTALVLWELAALLVFFSGLTLYMVPHLSLGAELGESPTDRNRLYAAHSLGFSLGMMVALAGLNLVAGSSDQRHAASSVAAIAAVVGSLVLLVPIAYFRGRSPHRAKQDRPALLGGLAHLRSNSSARRLLGAWFLLNLGIGGLASLAPFVAEYVLREPRLTMVLPALFALPAVVCIPLYLALAARWGRARVLRIALGCGSAALGALVGVGEGDALLAGILAAAAGASVGAGNVLVPSLLSEEASRVVAEPGARHEGSYFAVYGLLLKLAFGLQLVVVGGGMSLAGFEPGEIQTTQVEWTLRILFAVVPCAALLAAAVLLRPNRGSLHAATAAAEPTCLSRSST